jgi:hypothetical protein
MAPNKYEMMLHAKSEQRTNKIATIYNTSFSRQLHVGEGSLCYEISGSQGGEDRDDSLLGCYAV